MTKHNDISSFAPKEPRGGNKKSILETVHENSINVPKKAGRKPIAASKKKTAPVTITFTQSEIEKIRENAGQVPLAIFLKSQLNEDIFK